MRRAHLVFVVALVLPLTAVGAVSSDAITTWLSTGYCPGGAMDQAAAPCGFFTFFARVFLGGWTMFVVLPVYVLWWLLCFLVWRIAKRRTKSSVGRSPLG